MHTLVGIRRTLVAAAVALVALCGGLAAQASAQTTYPPGANTFNNGTEGWAAVQGQCTLGGDEAVPLICEVKNVHSVSQGNPPGTLETSFTTLVNALELLVGEATWRSPAFQVAQARATQAGPTVFTIDRQADVQALVDIGGYADYHTLLVDQTTGTAQMLTSARFEDSDSYTTDKATLPEGTLQAGHTYHIDIVTRMTTTVVQAIQGIITVHYDNVKLVG